MKEEIKLAIVGSRTFNDQNIFDETLIKLEEEYDIVTVVSGGARGADSMGEQYANQNGIDKLIFKADWKTYGKRAGFIRNVDIIKNCDVCVAFWDGESHGTKHDIELCEQYNKKCYIVNYVTNEITIKNS